jgi:hypothetical protein
VAGQPIERLRWPADAERIRSLVIAQRRSREQRQFAGASPFGKRNRVRVSRNLSRGIKRVGAFKRAMPKYFSFLFSEM